MQYDLIEQFRELSDHPWCVVYNKTMSSSSQLKAIEHKCIIIITKAYIKLQ